MCAGVLAVTGCAAGLAPLADEALPPVDGSVRKPRISVQLAPSRVRVEARITTLATHTLNIPVASASWTAPRGRLEESVIEIQIALDAVTSAPQKLADIAKSPNFLDASVFPRGRIEGRWLRPQAGNDARAHQLFFDLVLKDRRRHLRAPATLVRSGCDVRMITAFTFDRHDFGIASDGGYEKLVGREVEVSVEASTETAPFGVPCAAGSS